MRADWETRPLRFLARYLWRHRLAHGVVLLAVLGAVAASVGERYSMKFLVDAMAGKGRFGAWQAFGIFIVCVGADYFLWRVGGFVSARIFPRICADLRLDLFRHLIGHSTRYFNERLSGGLAARISNAANALFTVGNSFIWNVLPPAAATIGALIALAFVAWPMAVALTVASGLIAVGVAFAGVRGRSLHRNFADRAASVAGEIVDVVANHATVRVFGGGPREVDRLSRSLEGEMSAQQRALLHVERLRLCHAAAVWVLSGATLAWAVWLWQGGKITAGDVIVCGAFTLALLQSSRDLAVALVEMTHYWSRVAEAIDTLMVPHERMDHSAELHAVPRRGAVALEHVSFHHGPGEPVLRNVDFQIAPGERVGVVGPSGAGKSTLLAVMQRLYPVDRGRILVDGTDIASLDEASLRCIMTVVPQDVSLFHRSILENIRYGRPGASDEDVYAAAQAASCEEFIAGLPKGYATLVGERGSLLSAGQKQRVAIARALLSDAPVLLLDEATSALDVETEIAVQRAIGERAGGRTIVAVAHRLSTVANFDRIVVLEDGRVVEDGAPADLLRSGGSFARLWQMQQDELDRPERRQRALRLIG
jgi:ATP-binding cassette subfamily B protein